MKRNTNVLSLLFLLGTLPVLAQPLATLEPRQSSLTPIGVQAPALLRQHAAFGATDEDPRFPVVSRMVEGSDQSLYSTVLRGGTAGWGAIYKVTLEGKFSIVTSFDPTRGDASDRACSPDDDEVTVESATTARGGYSPSGGLTLGKDGYFYGVTREGGACGHGTIYKVPPQGGEPTILWSFRNGWLRKLPQGQRHSEQEILNARAALPEVPPMQLGDRFYGVTPYSNNQKYGVLYQISAAGGFRAIYYFKGDKGTQPNNLTVGGDGNIYGTTYTGTTAQTRYGTIFKYTPGDREITTLHRFSFTDGGGPTHLITGTDGNLYGTTYYGGNGRQWRNGVVFRYQLPGFSSHPVESLIPPDSQLRFSVLHKFDAINGSLPQAGLLEASDGFLYGAARGGGRSGLMYRLNRVPDDGDMDFEVLQHFRMYENGHNPMGTPIQHSNGNIYGTTYQGGSYGKGAVYCLDLCMHYKQASSTYPATRVCCALANNGALDRTELTGHSYSHRLTNSVPLKDGYVYTSAAGLMDMGHVADVADLTMFVYSALFSGYHCINLAEGFVRIPDIPMDHELRLQIAASIAFVESMAHELRTWGTAEDYSAFSPEDIPSNLIGLELGQRAIRATNYLAFEADYNNAVDHELDWDHPDQMTLVHELGAQTEARTEEVDDRIRGPDGWYESGALFNTILHRRNFDGKAWMAGMPYDAPQALPYLDSRKFAVHYDKFDYTMHNDVRTKNGIVTGATIREDTIATIVATLYRDFVSDNGVAMTRP